MLHDTTEARDVHVWMQPWRPHGGGVVWNSKTFRSPIISFTNPSFQTLLTNNLFPQQSQVARNLIMSEQEITAVLDKAHTCVDSECAIDDVDSLISELKEQQSVLNDRLGNIMNAVAHLQKANTAKDRESESVRGIIKDMLRVFTTVDDKFAIGFSGDIVAGGSTTAYDALPPKPWKAPAN